MDKVIQDLIEEFWDRFATAQSFEQYKDLLNWFDQSCVDYFELLEDEKVRLELFDSVPILSLTAKVMEKCPEAVTELSEENFTFAVSLEHLKKMSSDQIAVLKNLHDDNENSEYRIFDKDNRTY